MKRLLGCLSIVLLVAVNSWAIDNYTGAATGAELDYVAGATSNLQDQINLNTAKDVVYEADCTDNTTAKQICIEADGSMYVGTGSAAICVTCVTTLDDGGVVSMIGSNGSNTPTLYAIDTDIVTGVSASDDTWASAKAIDTALDAKMPLAGGSFSGGVTMADGQTITFDESAADPNDADVVLSAADGVFKIAAANGANNQDLTIDLDATANTATVSTSTGVTAINTTLNLVSTGTIRGKVHVATDADGKTLDKTTECNGSMQMATGAGTWVLPDIDDTDGTGWAVCVYSTTAAAVVIDPDAEDTITYDGTTDTAGDSITSASAAGDFACLMVTSVASNVANWTVLGKSGTWTQN